MKFITNLIEVVVQAFTGGIVLTIGLTALHETYEQIPAFGFWISVFTAWSVALLVKVFSFRLIDA